MQGTPTSNPKAETLGGTLTIGGDMPVQRLGYGAMRITGRGIWGAPASTESAHAVLRRAVERGITFIDTADAYGPNVSEELIAEALHPYAPGLVIATKGGLKRGGPDDWYPDGRPEHLKAAIEGSLKRLRLERIDLYQFHRPDPAVPFADSVGALRELQQAGKIRHIGLSNVNPEQLAEARRIVTIVSVQNRYNFSDRASDKVVDICAQDGLAFIPWYPLATGGLAGAALEAVAKRHQATPTQIGIAWLLQRSLTMLPIPGTSSVEHLEENIAAAAITLTDEDIQELAVTQRAKE